MLGPLPARESAVEACASSLRRAILCGELAPGSRLPPERTLAGQLGSSRVTVRSALGRLTAEHLLSVRQGSGYSVRDFREQGGPELLPGLARLAGTRAGLVRVAADLLLARRSLARAVLQRLVERGPRGARALGAAVDAFEAALRATSDPVAMARADLALLHAILAQTGSGALALCLNPVLGVVLELPELCAVMYADPAANVAAYRTLLAALSTSPAQAVEWACATLERRDLDTLARLERDPLKKERKRARS